MWLSAIKLAVNAGSHIYKKKKEKLPTGTCLILITPDSERTMCTFLGTSGKINENDIDLKIINKSKMIFLEGYLWDEGEPQKAFEKAIGGKSKVAMSLSDKFCVDRHKPHFLELVKNKLDITFANEEEILSLINTNNFQEVVSFAKEIKKTLIITRGEKDKEEYSYINIPIEGGYFLNKTVGFEYGKKEELYLKYISQQRIRWKKMKFENKEINSISKD